MSSVNSVKLSTTSWALVNLEDDIWITLTKNEIFDSIISAIGLTIALALGCDILLMFLAGTRKNITYYSVSRVIWAMNFKFTRRFQNHFRRHAIRKGGIPQRYDGINWRKYSGLGTAVLFFILEHVVIFLSMPIRRNIYGEFSERGGWQLNKKRLIYGAHSSVICSNQDLAVGHMVSSSAFISVCREIRATPSRRLTGETELLTVVRGRIEHSGVGVILKGREWEYGVQFTTSIIVDGRDQQVRLKQSAGKMMDIVLSMMKRKGLFVDGLKPLRCWERDTLKMCQVNINMSHPDLIEYDEIKKEYINDTFQVVHMRILQLFTGAIDITEGQLIRNGKPLTGKRKVGEAIYSLLPPLQVIILVSCLLVIKTLLGIVGLKVPSVINEAVVGYFSRLSCDELGSGPDQLIDITCSVSADGDGRIQYGTVGGCEAVDSFAKNTLVI